MKYNFIFFVLIFISCSNSTDPLSQEKAILTLDKDEINFAYVDLFNTKNETITLKNEGINVIKNLSFELSKEIDNFQIVDFNCKESLYEGEICKIIISFYSEYLGTYSSEMELNYFDGIEEKNIEIPLIASSNINVKNDIWFYNDLSTKETVNNVIVNNDKILVSAPFYGQSGLISVYNFDSSLAASITDANSKSKFAWSMCSKGDSNIFFVSSLEADIESDTFGPGKVCLADLDNPNILGSCIYDPNPVDADDKFGFKIAVNETENTLIVSKKNFYLKEASTYIYKISNNSIISDPILIQNPQNILDTDLSVSNNSLVLGVPAYLNDNGSIGTVFIYDTSTGQEKYKIINPDFENNSFGNSVFISNNLLFISAINESFKNSVYIYDFYNETWNFKQKIISPSLDSSFGKLLKYYNNILLIAGEEKVYIYPTGSDYDFIYFDYIEAFDTSIYNYDFASDMLINDKYIVVLANGVNNSTNAKIFVFTY